MRAVTEVAVLICIIPQLAAAQDKASAIRAFEEGRVLMKAGRYAEACPKLELSYRLEAATGALLNLADCNERIGKIASAWAGFREAAERATNQRRTARASEALRRAEALEPRLIRLTIAPPGDSVNVFRDGVDVTALAGVSLPIDPGLHVIEATAPGRVGWRTKLELSDEGSRHTVTVPELAPVAPAEPPASSERPSVEVPTPSRGEVQIDRRRRDRRLVLAAIVGGAGALALGTAATLGVVANSGWNNAERLGCVDGRCPDPAGFDEARRAHRLARVADVALIAGGAAALTGLILWATAPDARRVEVAPQIGPTAVGLLVTGRL